MMSRILENNNISDYQLLLDTKTTSPAVIRWNAKGRVTGWNNAAEIIFGYTKEEIVGKHTISILFVKKDKALVDKITRSLSTNHDSETIRTVCITKGGRNITCEWHTIPFSDEKGGTALVLDVTNRRNIEEKLYQLASIVEDADVAIVSVTTDGKIESWNKGAEQIYGYSVKEALGKSCDITIPKSYQKELHSMLEAVKKGKHLTPFETVRQRKDGTEIAIFLTISPRKDIRGNVVGTSHIARDITQRKKAEQALQESEERYRSVISSLQEGIIVQDKDGKIQTCNTSACTILGLSKGELLGKTPLDKDWYVVHEDGSLFIGEEHPAMISLKTGKAMSNVTMGIHKKSGERSWIRVNAQPMFAAHQKKPFAVITSLYDITDQRNSEQALLELNKQLTRSNNELEDFASVASHDLQEPLRKIQAFGDRLKTKYAASLPVEAQDYLSRMQHAAQRMHTLINDLLVFSRVTTKAQPYRKVDLDKIATEVLSDMEITIEMKKAKVIIEDLPVIEADPLQMRQMFQNFISNSLKFQKKNTTPIIRISAHLLKGKDKKPYYELAFSDNGIGFDTKYLHKIFNVFQRLHTQHEYSGTGVGLAVCRKIAERHNGSITAESTIGKGSTFIVTLPLQQKKPVINLNADETQKMLTHLVQYDL